MHLTSLFIGLCLVGSMSCVPRLQKRDVTGQGDEEVSVPSTDKVPEPVTISKPIEVPSLPQVPDMNAYLGQVFSATGSDKWIQDANSWISDPSKHMPSWFPFGNKPE